MKTIAYKDLNEFQKETIKNFKYSNPFASCYEFLLVDGLIKFFTKSYDMSTMLELYQKGMIKIELIDIDFKKDF